MPNKAAVIGIASALVLVGGGVASVAIPASPVHQMLFQQEEPVGTGFYTLPIQIGEESVSNSSVREYCNQLEEVLNADDDSMTALLKRRNITQQQFEDEVITYQIDRILFRQEAEKRGITVEDSEIDALINQDEDSNQISDVLDDDYGSIALDTRERAYETLLMEKIFPTEPPSTIVEPKELMETLEAIPDAKKVAERETTRYRLIRMTDVDESIDEIYAYLMDHRDNIEQALIDTFGDDEYAAYYSCSYKWTGLSNPADYDVSVLKDLHEGEFSQPIHINDNYYIMQKFETVNPSPLSAEKLASLPDDFSSAVQEYLTDNYLELSRKFRDVLWASAGLDSYLDAPEDSSGENNDETGIAEE